MADLRNRPTETARRQLRSAWMVIALAAALVLLIVLLVPRDDAAPDPGTKNTGASTAQPSPEPNAK